jgi:hypothetical protein
MFTVSVSQNPYLAVGTDEVHAVLTVNAAPDPVGASPGAMPELPRQGGTLVFGIMLDCSGSMGADNDERMKAARQAVLQVLEVLTPESYFFIIAGRTTALVLVPVCQATPENKARAGRLVSGLNAGDGTCMSTWLNEAKLQFNFFRTKHPMVDGIFQALLLTDGKNDAKDKLGEALVDCRNIFQCHARGVGLDWQVAELRQIASQLLGTLDIIVRPEQMSLDFQSILAQAQNQVLSQVRLRIWLPQGTSVLFFKQVSPAILTLHSSQMPDPLKPNTLDFETGSWSAKEDRDFHLAVRVKPGQIGQKMLAARVSLVGQRAGQFEKLAEAQVLAIWTDEEARTAILDRTVAHYSGQGELANAIQEGLAARNRGDRDLATRKLSAAVKLASGDDTTTRLLRRVVDIDTMTGTVRLKRVIAEEDVMTLDTRSTKTRRVALSPKKEES